MNRKESSLSASIRMLQNRLRSRDLYHYCFGTIGDIIAYVTGLGTQSLIDH